MTKDNLYRMEDYDGFYDREEEEMYEEAVQRIERDIPAYMYTAPYDEFMHFIIQNHHELNRSYSEPCLAEIAYDKYVRLNKKTLKDPEAYSFAFDRFVEKHKIHIDDGSRLYEVTVTFYDDLTTEETRKRIKERVSSDSIVEIQGNVVVFQVRIDDEHYILPDLEIKMFYLLDDYRLGTYSTREIFENK